MRFEYLIPESEKVRRVCYAARLLMFAVALSLFGTATANAENGITSLRSFIYENFEYEDPFAPCSGNCGVHVFAGRFLDTGMNNVFGLNKFIPPWGYDFGDSGIVGLAFSKRFLTGFNSFSVEAELGVAQRVGPGAEATEVWGALYGRWHNFPWNDFVYTTVAVSTGFNYASTIDRVEQVRSADHSNLLHYLAPEITFADPKNRDTSLVIRLHHRSGGRILGWTGGIFNGTAGGAQYITVGIRKHF